MCRVIQTSKILIITILTLLATGCARLLPASYDYSFSCINEGKETVWVDEFKLTETREGIVMVGILTPGSSHGVALFRNKPMQKITLSWCPLTETERQLPPGGKRTQMDVVLNPPKEFTPRWGSEINLYLIPETGEYRVEWEIMNPRTGDTKILRQQ